MFEGKTILTGVKPTGTPHLGNYLGAIKPAIKLGQEAIANGGKQYMFIADYHAINAEKNPEILSEKLKEIACIYLAGGLDPNKSYFYRQSDIPEIPEITTILYAYIRPRLIKTVQQENPTMTELIWGFIPIQL